MVAALSVATWLYFGYRWKVWPQPGFFDHVLRYDGQLHNDWHTSLPPVHWAFTHVLGLVPPEHLESALLVSWIAGIVLLWIGFVALANRFGLGLAATLGAGLVAIPTGFGGVGVSETLFGFLYPTAPAFALAVCALAALAHRRPALAGACLGLATIVHPNVGALSAAVIAPAVLLLPGPWRANTVRLAVPLALLALPALALTASQQTGGGNLSSHQAYELLAVVRQPHHMLFSFFPPSEYLRLGLWLALGTLGVVLLWRMLAARIAAVVMGLVLVGLAVGAAAGEAGSPLLLVQLQLSRLSPFIVLLGVLAGAGVLARFAPRLAPALLALCLVLTTPLLDRLGVELSGTRYAMWPTASLVIACLVGAAILGAAVLSGRLPRVPTGVAVAAAVVAVAGAGVDLVARHHERVGDRTAQDIAYEDVALHARWLTRDGEVVITPPDLDGFRMFSHRPVVVEFGTFRYGEGDTEWVRRMDDLTGDPAALAPALGTDVIKRVARIGSSYDRHVAATPAPACKYHARYEVARIAVPVPPWLERVYANDMYQLLRLRPGTCDGASS